MEGFLSRLIRVEEADTGQSGSKADHNLAHVET